ncbi:hypothetical protein [Paraburkholderia sp. SOS3]|uniref:hypothetical protein n=1 Tax=Paraburkholderia sp. SOS3 TaxID=1926494 RepID=UPI0009474CB7|nr:hypothetical protein [Paraburkholderia sp. SOS3]APR40033.1 hypothetical protein BTO02_33370 [Paraburkholderia sp. SOS3]APR40502.1 hypothetical protein BTO02_33720 [Paraburkholderia sp. SOS3]
MPQNGLNLGRDYKFDILTATGPLVLPTLLNFKRRKINQKLTVKPLNSLPIQLNFQEGGWEGSFEVSRADATLDAYFASIEASYYAGVNQPPGFIQETIEEVAGVVSTFQYQGVVLYFEDAGDAEAEKNVIQRVSFAASTRIQLN